MSERPVVAILVAHYLPGSKGGGPIRSVANLVAALGQEFDFRIVTHDRDLGDTEPYPGVPRDAWTPVGLAQVRYLSPEAATRAGVASVLSDLAPDLVYCQSYFSPLFSIWPRVLRRRGRLSCPLLVAPRGEFSPGALALKGRKKRAFLALGRMLGLDRDVLWHATASEEAEDIRRTIGREARIFLAAPLPTPDDRPLAPREKIPGELEVVFVSRITPKKNLLGAIEILKGIAGIRLTVYGPKEDLVYWDACTAQAHKAQVTLIDGGVLAPDEVRSAFERGHLFLFPTLGENYGHVIMESLSAGTPVLLSDQTPWKDSALLGAGWNFDLTDLHRFRETIEAVCAMDAPTFAALSQRSYDVARDRRQNPSLIAENRNLMQVNFK